MWLSYWAVKGKSSLESYPSSPIPFYSHLPPLGRSSAGLLHWSRVRQRAASLARASGYPCSPGSCRSSACCCCDGSCCYGIHRCCLRHCCCCYGSRRFLPGDGFPGGSIRPRCCSCCALLGRGSPFHRAWSTTRQTSRCSACAPDASPHVACPCDPSAPRTRCCRRTTWSCRTRSTKHRLDPRGPPRAPAHQLPSRCQSRPSSPGRRH